jgi:phosphoserine phosphatase RsbU/P
MNAAAIAQTYTDAVAAQGRVLIADDQSHVVEALEWLLKDCGFATWTAEHPSRVLSELQANEYDAVLMDLNYTRDTTGGGEGLELVSQIRSLDKLLPVVVMTAWGSVDLAVEAMRRGASDFIQKPWENHQLVEKLQEQVARAREQRRVQRLGEDEQREAREIQQNLLPRRLPEVAGYDVAALTQPMRFVGGDYFNLARIGEHQVMLSIADVAGKGLPAALLMSSLHAALTPLIWQGLPPRELCRRLNRILCDMTPVGKFISFFYAVLDYEQNRLTYCNAGHNPALVIGSDGSSGELQTGGAVLGQFPAWAYEQRELQMKSGDRLVIFTDGLVEASNDREEFFGEENLVRIAREKSGSSAKELMDSLIEAASRHCGGHFQDDASLIVLKSV